MCLFQREPVIVDPQAMPFSQIRQATPARVSRLREQQRQLVLRQTVGSSSFCVWVIVFQILFFPGMLIVLLFPLFAGDGYHIDMFQ